MTHCFRLYAAFATLAAVAISADDVHSGGAAAQRRHIPQFQYDARAEKWLAPSGAFDMPATVRRFLTDRRTLAEYYDTRLSPERVEAFTRFDNAWLAVLDRVPYDALDADPKRSIPAARVFAELRVRHRARTSSPRTAPSRLHETR